MSIWHLRADPNTRFRDLGADHYDRHFDTNAKKRNHVRQLEALGYRLRDGRANMGVSLLSGKPTLSETLTLDTLNAALDGNGALQQYLWDGPEPEKRVAALKN